MNVLNFARISKLSSLLLGIVTFIRLTSGSKVEDFLRWIHLGGLLDFVLNHYNLIAPVLVVGFLLQWIKDWRWLAGIGLLVFLFITLGL
jgi:hypothetical protein